VPFVGPNHSAAVMETPSPPLGGAVDSPSTSTAPVTEAQSPAQNRAWLQLLATARDNDKATVQALISAQPALLRIRLPPETPVSPAAKEVAGRPASQSWCGLFFDNEAYGNEAGMAALHVAAYSGAVATSTALLAAGAEPEVALEDGSTPLHLAAFGGHTGVGEALLRSRMRPAPVNSMLRGGGTALHNAVFFRRAPFVALLLRHGADVEQPNCWENTSLHDAVAQHAVDFDILRMLLQRSPHLETRNREGRTPLAVAVAKRHMRAARQLIAVGADPSAVQDEDRPSVLRWRWLCRTAVSGYPNLYLASPAATHEPLPPEPILYNCFSRVAHGEVPLTQELVWSALKVSEPRSRRHPDNLLHGHWLVRLLDDAGLLPTDQNAPEFLSAFLYQPGCWALSTERHALGRCILQDAKKRGFLCPWSLDVCTNALEGRLEDRLVASAAAAGLASLHHTVSAAVHAMASAQSAATAAAARGDRISIAVAGAALALGFVPIVGPVLSAAVSVGPPLWRMVENDPRAAAVAFVLNPADAAAAARALSENALTAALDEGNAATLRAQLTPGYAEEVEGAFGWAAAAQAAARATDVAAPSVASAASADEAPTHSPVPIGAAAQPPLPPPQE